MFRDGEDIWNQLLRWLDRGCAGNSIHQLLANRQWQNCLQMKWSKSWVAAVLQSIWKNPAPSVFFPDYNSHHDPQREHGWQWVRKRFPVSTNNSRCCVSRSQVSIYLENQKPLVITTNSSEPLRDLAKHPATSGRNTHTKNRQISFWAKAMGRRPDFL